MRDDLLDAQAALDWAVTQIPSLQEAFLVWQRGNPYRIVQETDPDGGPDFAVAYQEKPLPRALNAWVGAIINSMRSSLDVLAATASRSTVLGGSAVFEAANALLAKIRTAAGARLGCPAEQVELADGCARALDGLSPAFAELAADGIRATTAFGNDNRLTYTYGSAAAHVAVDPGTGDVELLDCLVVEDVGRIVNPLTLHGQ